jgi:hypothetical protein
MPVFPLRWKRRQVGQPLEGLQAGDAGVSAEIKRRQVGQPLEGLQAGDAGGSAEYVLTDVKR